MSPPARLGRYPVRRRLGAGAFATVWLAHDDQLDSAVAIKVLADNWAGDDHVRRRFLEEGRFLRKVESPHVVPVYDFGELEDGRPFLVMAYADGGSLAERLAAGPLERTEALRVVREVGEGLRALHARGVLHRDVKPANVLFRDGGDRVRAMVADLGLGKALDVSSRLTVVAGTPSYVSPEQARGEGLDARADQFSLAALAHLLLLGRPPHQHSTLTSAADPPPLAPMVGDVPPEVESVLRRALSPDREDRYSDVESFVAALGAALDQHGDHGPAPTVVQPVGETVPDAPPDRGPRRWPGTAPWVAAGVVALALGGVGGWVLQQQLDEERTLSDAADRLEVVVPAGWTRTVQGDGWTPPGQDVEQPALAAGTGPGWREDGQGVFLGLLEGAALPRRLPGHPECAEAGQPVRGTQDDGGSVTAVHTGCGGADGSVVVERVVQVAEGRLLWVQVRSDDPGTAHDVLDTVDVRGM